MIGNIIILIRSWLLLLIRKVKLSVLTGTSVMYRLLQLVAGFVSTAFLAGCINLIFALVAGFYWEPTGGLGIGFILKGLYNYIQQCAV